MTPETNKLNLKECSYGYDYANKCDCSEDDKCGCSYPNNIPHDFDVKCEDGRCLTGDNSRGLNVNKEKIEIQTPNVHIKKDSICTCTPEECECTVIRDEYVK